ncbi:hypothetical protein [Dickeya sp. ws52]|uniref:hypothetical protein n=1 Tax=Dickeya sp. ws52 TaxID=2576377 RepID=UPI00117CA85C|nr:hypothetical protein [Dickeya sp. ws52]TYL43929.1 hypothetical protein FDP13_03755 [Dickeya sp. ws52]
MKAPNIAGTGTPDERHQLALDWVCHAFLLHQVAMHRRTIYRHAYGDIELSLSGPQGLVDSHLEEAGYSVERRFNWYMRMLNNNEEMRDSDGFQASLGRDPALTREGIQWLGCLLDQFGDMVQELGPAAFRKLVGGIIDDE